jgi:hypothetical protein
MTAGVLSRISLSENSVKRSSGIIGATAIIAMACASVAVSDPHAIAPTYDRWEAHLPSRDPSPIFQAAIAVLVDSGYTIRNADRANGIIATNLRYIRDAEIAGDHRLDLMVLALSPDSARIVVRGEFCHTYEGALRCYPKYAASRDWRIVRGIGESILARASGP